MKFLPVACLLAAVTFVAGCTSMTNAMREVMGYAPLSEASVGIRPAETRWLLVKNPRFGDVPSEPEYIWVEEDKVPTTITTLIRGEKAIIAAPEIVARYGTPPGGGKISARQGIALASEAPAPTRAATVRATGSSAGAPGRPTTAPRQGLVLYVDTSRVAVDLTAADGVRPGTMLSLRRDRIPIVHPVTGEVLGDLDEEVGTAVVTEVREKFSVAEMQKVAPGASVQIKDRVVAK